MNAIPKTAKQPERRTQEILLKEYEIARRTFDQLEENIWQSAAVFIVLSLGGISALSSLSAHDWSNLVIVASVGFISIAILVLWYGSVNRWWSLEEVALFRMREIEESLGMWTQRYIRYLDSTRIYKQAYTPANKQEMSVLSNLGKKIKKYTRAPVRRRVRALVFILVLGWLVLITRELLLVIFVS